MAQSLLISTPKVIPANDNITVAVNGPMWLSRRLSIGPKSFRGRTRERASTQRLPRQTCPFTWRRFNTAIRFLGMNLSHGGHLTHGHPLMNFSASVTRLPTTESPRETETIDYDELQRIAEESTNQN
jgi:hypothetical protein